jgi:hypothetical protein
VVVWPAANVTGIKILNEFEGLVIGISIRDKV